MFEIQGTEAGTEGVCGLLTGVVNLRRRKPAQTKQHREPAGPLAATIMAKEVIVVGKQHAQRARALKFGRTERVGVIGYCCCNRIGCRSIIRTRS